jgi:hypothetical protein
MARRGPGQTLVDVGHDHATGAAHEIHHELRLFVWESARKQGVIR